MTMLDDPSLKNVSFACSGIDLILDVRLKIRKVLSLVKVEDDID
jgi:hypothetical protein